MNKIRVYHVEDYAIMRNGVNVLLNMDPRLEVIGQSANEHDLFVFLQHHPVDVLILDILLDGMQNQEVSNGYTICQRVKAQFPGIKILAHSVFDDADSVAKILKAGASGFVSKKAEFTELILGVKEVYGGKLFICSQTSRRMKNLSKFLQGIEKTLKDKQEIFSTREREILTLLSKGDSSKQVSSRLFITERTVESHRQNMLVKVNVKNTAELVAYASRLGLLTP